MRFSRLFTVLLLLIFVSFNFCSAFSRNIEKNNASASTDLSLKEYVDPERAFSVNIPENWNTLEYARVGQRITVFSDKEIRSLDDAEKDLDLSFSVSLLKNDHKQKSRDEILEEESDILFKLLQEKAKSKGDKLVLLEKKKTNIGGLNAINYTTKIIEKKGTALISNFAVLLSDRYIINFFFNARTDDQDNKTIYSEIVRSFHLINKEDITFDYREFKMRSHNISLMVPTNSSIEGIPGKDSYKLILTLTPESDHPVDMIITKIYYFDEYYPVDRYSIDLIDKTFLFGLYESIYRPKLFIEYDFYDTKHSDICVVEMSYEKGEKYITSIVAARYKNNTLISFMMEVPTLKFERYRKMFNTMIRSLDI